MLFLDCCHLEIALYLQLLLRFIRMFRFQNTQCQTLKAGGGGMRVIGRAPSGRMSAKGLYEIKSLEVTLLFFFHSSKDFHILTAIHQSRRS